MTKIKDEVKILKAARKNQQSTNNGAPLRLSTDISTENLQVRRGWHGIFKVKKGKNIQQEYSTQQSYLSSLNKRAKVLQTSKR